MSDARDSASLDAVLLVGGERYRALECSPAGLSLPHSVLACDAFQDMHRGERRAAALQLRGSDGEAEFDVQLRLAAQGPAHVEFAFVALAPEVRRALERAAATPVPENADLVEAEADLPAPAALRFARLAEVGLPQRRLILPSSAAVLDVTQARRARFARETVAAPAPRIPRHAGPPGDAAWLTITTGMLLGWGFGLMTVLALALVWLFG